MKNEEIRDLINQIIVYRQHLLNKVKPEGDYLRGFYDGINDIIELLTDSVEDYDNGK